MIFAIDFDATLVVQDGRSYDDTTTPLEFMPGAREALHMLKAAGHLLILWSGRSSKALLFDPMNDPLVRTGKKTVSLERWERSRPINQARLQQMLDFVDRELPGVFDAIDDGAAGKLTADCFIDDKAMHFGSSFGIRNTWERIAFLYGQGVAK